jgi:hypothetical protein
MENPTTIAIDLSKGVFESRWSAGVGPARGEGSTGGSWRRFCLGVCRAGMRIAARPGAERPAFRLCSSARRAHVGPLQCSSRIFVTAFVLLFEPAPVGVQWELRGAVTRRDQRHAFGFFLNPAP